MKLGEEFIYLFLAFLLAPEETILLFSLFAELDKAIVEDNDEKITSLMARLMYLFDIWKV